MEDKHQEESEPPGEGARNMGKWKGALKGLKKLFSSRRENIPEAEIIQRLIRKENIYDCVKKLIAIENADPDDIPLHYKDMDALYESLEKAMEQVIFASNVHGQVDSLKQVIKAIQKREKEDAKILKNKDITGHNQKRPRKWKDKWKEWVEASVAHRCTKAFGIPTNCAAGSCSSQRFGNLGKAFKNDLIHVIRDLSPHYPPEFNVINLYAQCYHKYFVSEITFITEYQLTEEDTYFVLRWMHNIYPQTILRDPAVQGHIDESKLESLLPPKIIQNLEKDFVTCEVDSLEMFFEESLNLEKKRWKDGKEPKKAGRYYQSELQAEVPQKYYEKIQRASQISKEMSLKMAPLLGQELQKFLTRYQYLVVEYTKNKKRKHFKAITMANINCSREFGDLLKDARMESREKENLSLRLRDFETLGYDALLQDMFKKLKSRYRKLCHGKVRKENFSDLMHYVRSCITSLKPLCQPSFQNSQETWLYPLLGKLAEILGLEKQEDIIQNISELSEVYTDIGTEHIVAILHMKGNMDKPQAASALEQILYRTRRAAERAESPPLFSLITPFSSQWLLSDNSRRGESICDCVFAARMTVKFAFHIFIDFWCKKFNTDTPPEFYPHNPAVRIPKARIQKLRGAYKSQYVKMKLISSGQRQYSTFTTSHIDV